jgi:hypothetical protein
MNKLYSHTCVRCGKVKTYTTKSHWENLAKRTDCVFCKGIPDESLSRLVNDHCFVLHCKRCHEFSEYVSKQGLVMAARAQRPDCVKCHGIPDATLHLFISKKILARICPKCQSLVEHSTKPVLKAAIRANYQCHLCAMKETGESNHRLLRAQWTPIIGYENYIYKTLEMVRNHWETLNETERQDILNKTSRQRYYKTSPESNDPLGS